LGKSAGLRFSAKKLACSCANVLRVLRKSSVPKLIKRDEVQPPARPETFRLPKPGCGDPYWGLSRSWYFQAERRGWIRMIRLCREGRQRGVTLIDFQQVSKFVRSQTKGGK
jgi:hypothetical protein